jgi:hypothetical protein
MLQRAGRPTTAPSPTSSTNGWRIDLKIHTISHENSIVENDAGNSKVSVELRMRQKREGMA